MAVSHSIDSFFRFIRKARSAVQFYPDDLNQSLRADNTSLQSSLVLGFVRPATFHVYCHN